MARVKTRTATSTQIRVGVNVDADKTELPVQEPVIVPTEEEIFQQLSEHFKGERPEKELRELTNLIGFEFQRIKDLPYGDSHPMSKFAVYTRPKPELVIHVYDDGFDLFQKEFYPADYSTVSKLFYHHMTITVVTAVKRIQLAYVKH